MQSTQFLANTFLFATDVSSVVIMVVAGLLVAVFIAAAAGALFAASLRNRWQKLDAKKRSLVRRGALIAVAAALLVAIAVFFQLRSTDQLEDNFRHALALATA